MRLLMKTGLRHAIMSSSWKVKFERHLMGCSTSKEATGGRGPAAATATSSTRAPRSRHKKLDEEEDSAYLTSTTWVDQNSLVLDRNGGSSSHLPTTSAGLTLPNVQSLAERPPAAPTVVTEVSVEGAVSLREVTK